MSNTEKLIEQTLTRADEIGAKAWAELVHYYYVRGAIQVVFGVGLIVGLAYAARLLVKNWKKLDDPEMFAIFGGLAGTFVLIFAVFVLGDGITYLLAPGGSALSEALK